MARARRSAGSGTRITREEPIDVLIVEHHDDTREMLRALLAHVGMTTRVCASVQTALDAIGARSPDIVITDLALPDRGGDELAAVLRADRDTMHIALVAITGVVDPEWSVLRCFDAYLRKPVDLELLPDLLSSLHDAARSSRDRRRQTGQ